MNSTVYSGLGISLTNNIATTRFYFKYSTRTNAWMPDYAINTYYEDERNGFCPWGNCYQDANIGLINISDFSYASLADKFARGNGWPNSANETRDKYNWIGKMMYSSLGSGNGTWTIQNASGKNGNSNYNSSNCMIVIYSESNYSSSRLMWCNSSSSYYYIFPVFYLKNQIYYSKGNGTSTNPYYVEI